MGSKRRRLTVQFRCTTKPKPPHLVDKEFPFDKQHSCKCPHPLAIVAFDPPPRSSAEQMDLQERLCEQLDVSLLPVAQAILSGQHMAELTVFPQTSGDHRILWYPSPAYDSQKIYPVDITYWYILPGIMVRGLPFVRAPSRKRAFHALSDEIESVCEHIPEEKYRLLWGAAKAVYDSVLL